MIPSTELFFDDRDDRHEYLAGPRKLTSVTTLLRQYKYYPSYEFLATSNRIQDPTKYKSLGTGVHAATHLNDLGMLEEKGLHEEVTLRLAQYRRFLRDTGYQPRVWELALADTDIGIAGMIDSMGVCGDEIWMPDLKTGTVPLVGVATQLGGYFRLVTGGGRIMRKTIPEDPRIPPVDVEWFEDARRQVKRIRRVSVGLSVKDYTVRTHNESRWLRSFDACVTMHNDHKEFKLA